MARLFVSASSQYLQNTTITVPALPVSLACWYRPTTIGLAQAIMGFSDGTANNLRRVLLLSTGELSVQEFANPTNGQATTTGTLTAGVWAFCGAVFTSATARAVYFNAETASDTTNVTPAGLDRFHIGLRGDAAQFANGDVAEVAIWNAALSAGDMAFLARGYAPPSVKPGFLRHYWDFRGGQSPEPDRGIPGGASLALVNGPAFSSHPPFIIYPRAEGVRGGRRSRRGV